MWILPLFILAWLAESKSSGIVTSGDINTGCDWEAVDKNSGKPVVLQWGCQGKVWNGSNDFPFARGFCQDPTFNTQKFMWWTGAPRDEKEGIYTIRTGRGDPTKDPKSYVPGRYVSIYISVLKFDAFYRGLLMFAKDSNGNKTGDWNVPWEPSPQFAAAPSIMCNKSVMHFNAEDKPYVAKFNFIAPPAGTGPVTIKAMLKTGPPNPTDFGDFIKLPPLVLQEQVPQDVRKWVLLNEGVSCKDYCVGVNPNVPCSDVALRTSMDGIVPNPLDTIYPCHGAVFHDCEGQPRVNLPNRFCTYAAPVCTPAPKAPAKCDEVATAATPMFCICGAPITGSPTAVPGTPGISASSQLIPSLSAVLALLSMGSWGNKGFMAWGVAAVLFAAVPMASAHNWAEGTRGRASNLGANTFCSPAFPQVTRQKVHMQVALDQPFIVEWASAHGDATYWIIIHDDDRANVSKLTRSLMDNWLANCPGGGAANTTQTGMKYQRFRPNKNLQSMAGVNTASASPLPYSTVFYPDGIYNGTIYNEFSVSSANPGRPTTFFQSDPGMTRCKSQTTGPEVIAGYNCSAGPASLLAKYKEQYLATDRRCTYTNASNPWIRTIHRYQHYDVSDGFTTATMTIPSFGGTAKTGRYQVHYKWSSYCDTIDVDVKAKGMTVANPYGLPYSPNDITYDVAHHCKFELGTDAKVGQCVEVVTTTQQCEALCNTDSNCKGFQLLPLQLDGSRGQDYGLFPGESYVPWGSNMSFCDKTQFATAPKAGSMVCYTITRFQNDFNSARPLWSFTEDTDNQAFYGTCYIKPTLRKFDTIALVNDDKPATFRFQSKCIPCDNIGQDLSNPRWGPQQNFCQDCNKYPVAARQLPALPAWTMVGPGTFNQSAHWLSPGGSPYAFQDECISIAQRDPTCSKYVMYSDFRAQRLSGNINGTGVTANKVGTSNVMLIATSPSWHYTSVSLNHAYFRSCACLDKSVADGLNGAPPVIDTSMTALACDGVTKLSDCFFRNFTIYKLP